MQKMEMTTVRDSCETTKVRATSQGTRDGCVNPLVRARPPIRAAGASRTPDCWGRSAAQRPTFEGVPRERSRFPQADASDIHTRDLDGPQNPQFHILQYKVMFVYPTILLP